MMVKYFFFDLRNIRIAPVIILKIQRVCISQYICVYYKVGFVHKIILICYAESFFSHEDMILIMDKIVLNDIEIVQVNRRISVSETSDLAIFRTDGSLTRTVSDADQVDVSDLPSGIYIVRAQAGKKVKTEKVFLW